MRREDSQRALSAAVVVDGFLRVWALCAHERSPPKLQHGICNTHACVGKDAVTLGTVGLWLWLPDTTERGIWLETGLTCSGCISAVTCLRCMTDRPDFSFLLHDTGEATFTRLHVSRQSRILSFSFSVLHRWAFFHPLVFASSSPRCRFHAFIWLPFSPTTRRYFLLRDKASFTVASAANLCVLPTTTQMSEHGSRTVITGPNVFGSDYRIKAFQWGAKL